MRLRRHRVAGWFGVESAIENSLCGRADVQKGADERSNGTIQSIGSCVHISY